uniref:Uncharacterized protein n=1 Tax=Acrobeloides nanus TaxID=290746 RepID=A0A914CQQ8_9BILA
MKAVNYLKDQNIKFIATNEDLSDPGPIPGLIYPAAGCMSNCIANMSGRKPTVMGKPNTATFEYILTKIGIDPKKTLMIGDRGDTDMMFGNVHGMDTMLALSGICQLDDVEKFKKEGKKDFIPKYWVSSIGELLKHEKNSIEQGF